MEGKQQVGNACLFLDLPPLPAQENDGVPCPHCQRKFNAHSLERHEPICERLTAKNAFSAFNTSKRPSVKPNQH